MRVHYAIVFVSDMARSVAFYRDVIGMPLRFESPGWTEFETEGAILALHQAEGSAAGDASGKGAPGTSRPGLAVPDLDAFHRRMTEHAVRCIQEPRETFGTRLAQYADPDGLPISVSQAR